MEHEAGILGGGDFVSQIHAEVEGCLRRQVPANEKARVINQPVEEVRRKAGVDEKELRMGGGRREVKAFDGIAQERGVPLSSAFDPRKRDKMNQNQSQSKQKRPGVISPADFFSSDSEKTKLNWFLFEFALEIQSQIGKALKKRLQKAGISDAALAAFCIFYSKSMKAQILRQVAGKQECILHSYLPIEQYFSSLSDRLVDDLLTAVDKAWNEQTGLCVVCPTRCISERDYRADMFDDPDHYD